MEAPTPHASRSLFDPDRGNWETKRGCIVNAHGAHASVNTPPCPGVDFINVVTMAVVTTGNLRTLIMCRRHSSTGLLDSYPHTITHTRTLVYRNCILTSFLLQLSCVYNNALAYHLLHCGFTRLPLLAFILLLVTVYISTRHYQIQILAIKSPFAIPFISLFRLP